MSEAKIRKAIKRQGYKIGEFADLMGYHNNTLTPRLQKWNTKEVLKKISIYEATKWSKYLGLSIDELFNLKTK